MTTRRHYVPAYVAPNGYVQPIGTDTVWLPGALRDARDLQKAGEPGDAEIFVAYQDVPQWQRLSDEEIDAEMDREATRDGLM